MVRSIRYSAPKYALILLSFCLAFFYTLVYRDIRLNYHDEAVRIGRGYLLELALQKDFNNPLWFTQDGYDQPQLPQLLYGIMLYPRYVQSNAKDYLTFMIDQNLYDATKLDDTALDSYRTYQLNKPDFIYWENEIDAKNNQYVTLYGTGFQKTLDAIYQARRINILFLTLASLGIFLLARRFFAIAPSLFISVWFATNDLIVSAGLRAMNEGLFLVLFIIGLYLIINRSNMLLGIIAGLCMATKLNGAMLGLFTLFFFPLRKALLAISIAFFVFVLLNPFTYPNPIKNTWSMYKYRLEQVRRSQIFDPDNVLPRISDRLEIFVTHYFGPEQASLFSMPYGSHRVLPKNLAAILAIALFLNGIIYFGISSMQSKKLAQMIFLGILTFTLFIVYLGVYRSRYFVPVSVFVLWFQGLGLYRITRWALRQFAQ